MMKFLLVFCVLLLLPTVDAGASQLTVTEVAQGVFVHLGRHELPNPKNHGAIANIGFIVGDRCVAVIDSGGNPREGYALKDAIKKITPLPICYVINTHVHPDHIFGNIAFKKSGVKFVGHIKLSRAMSMRGSYYIDKASEQVDVQLTEQDIIHPNLKVKKNMELDLGGRVLKLTAYPTAHTDNDLTVYDEKTDTLWLSDLLFIDHIPVVDGSLKGWLQVLNQLEKQRFNIVIPGHGPIVKDWPNSMHPEKDYLQMLLDETREAIRKGVFLEDALKTIGVSAKERWKLFDEFHRKNVSTAYAELEWED